MISAALVAVLGASMPMAYGRTTMTPREAAPADNARLPHRVMADQVRFSDMNGATVYDPQDKSIGDINNVVIDRDGKVAAVIVKTGAILGIGGKTVAIAMNDLKVAAAKNGKPHFTLDMTKEQLQSAQSFNIKPPTTESGSSTPPADAGRK
jgi:sporulation protein YlmC with PRC-barrel domain